MSNKWPGCVKIHGGCGGVVRWIEAVEKPGVGYYGECVHCGESQLVVEKIVPIEDTDHREINDIPMRQLERVSWDDDLDWDDNQAAIREEVTSLG